MSSPEVNSLPSWWLIDSTSFSWPSRTFDDRARPQVPDEHAPVARHRRAVALVDEDEVLDVVRMPAQDELGTSVLEIPDDGRVVGRRRRGAASPCVDDDAVDEVPVEPEQLDAPAREVVERDCAVVARRHDLVGTRDPRGAGHRPSMPDEPVDGCSQRSRLTVLRLEADLAARCTTSGTSSSQAASAEHDPVLGRPGRR